LAQECFLLRGEFDFHRTGLYGRSSAVFSSRQNSFFVT
jgi:hypothetical protein